jgi:hypothetical protein
MIVPKYITLYCRDEEDGIYHAFPVDSSANHDTAKSWSRRYDAQAEPLAFEYENTKFDNITITSLEIRSEGGRAYQVVLEHNNHKFNVDLRESTLMDVIRNTGIQAGGRLNGSFCFAKDGSQTRLIREGTEEHKRGIQEREKRETFTKTIKRSELKQGHVYETVSGFKKAIFLGHVYAFDIDKETKEVSKPYKALLFYTGTEKRSVQHLLDLNFESIYDWSFEVVKSHSYKLEKEKLLDVDLDTIVNGINKYFTYRWELEIAKEANFTRSSTYRLTEHIDRYILSKIKVNKKDVVFSKVDIADMLNDYKYKRYGGW